MRNSTTGSAAPCGCGGAAASGGCGCDSCASSDGGSGGFLRPNFFSGQLLTEDDLDALVDYSVGKSRLHNRHFLGDGVVCGLQVDCKACGDGKIVVQPGHALDTCGNDLVLDCAVELDAIAMVRELRRNQLGGQDCGDPCPERSATGAVLGVSERQSARRYCLYLRYTEESVEPVTPYATDEACGTGACEFSRIREGVRFELRCAEDMPAPDGFISRFTACISDLTRAEAVMAALKRLASNDGNSDDVRVARDGLLTLLDTRPQLADCQLRAEVAALAMPAEGSDTKPATQVLSLALVRLLRDCLCHALLPPCPRGADSGVLLACFELLDCDVVSICNLERKFVLTGPNLRYWLPLNLIGDLFERFCCGALKIEQRTTVPGTDNQSLTTMAIEPAAASGFDLDTIASAMLAHVRGAFGMTERSAGQLANMGLDLIEIFKAGGFDAMLPARALRQVQRFSLREAAAGEIAESAAFESTRAQLADVQLQNQQLRTELDAMAQRLTKLEEKKPGK